jgi:hypothetical protein
MKNHIINALKTLSEKQVIHLLIGIENDVLDLENLKQVTPWIDQHLRSRSLNSDLFFSEMKEHSEEIITELKCKTSFPKSSQLSNTYIQKLRFLRMFMSVDDKKLFRGKDKKELIDLIQNHSQYSKFLPTRFSFSLLSKNTNKLKSIIIEVLIVWVLQFEVYSQKEEVHDEV